MFLSIFWFIFGLALILVGANILTDGAASLAKRLGISDLVVGLTIVAFGTSAPELVISVISAAEGNSDIAIGNVVGSNIFNILMIIGITSLIRPIIIKKNVLTREMPMLLLSSIILFILGNSAYINHSGINEITRVDAIILLILLGIFLTYTYVTARKNKETLPLDSTIIEDEKKEPTKFRSTLYIIVGLGGLIFGGDKFVDAAVSIAKAFNISDAIIGLTIVAFGTSLPELATSVIAAIKGKPGLAVGNVIGSNILNILLILGCAGTIKNLPFGNIDNFELITLLIASFAFYFFGWFFRKRTITRVEGFILVSFYVIYTILLLI